MLLQDLGVDGKICKKTGLACPGTCEENQDVTPRANDWYSPGCLDDLFGILKARNGQRAFFVMGNTSTGIQKFAL